jgi:hypothetical protein
VETVPVNIYVTLNKKIYPKHLLKDSTASHSR